MSFETRFLETAGRLHAALAREISGLRLVAFALAPVVLTIALGLIAGAIYVNNTPGDFFFMLDSAWRIASGQVPHLDFGTPIGGLYYLLLAGARGLFGPGPEAMGLAAPFAALVGAPLLALLAHRRMTGGYALALTWVVALRAVTPRSMDAVTIDFSFLAAYNSVSWLLIFPVAVAASFPARRRSGGGAIVAEALVLGALVAALAFLKMPYALVAAFLLLTGALAHDGPDRRTCLAGIAVAGVIVASVYVAAPRFVAAYWSDLAYAASVAPFSERVFGKISEILLTGFTTAALSVGMVWLVEQYRKAPGGAPLWRDVVRAAALLASGFGLTANNHDAFLFLSLLLFLFGHLFVMARGERTEETPDARRVRFALSAAPFLAVAGWFLVMDGAAVLAHTAAARLGAPLEVAAEAPGFERLKLPSSGGAWAADLPERLGEGVEVLRREGLADAKILTLDFYNPFPYLLAAPPPRGVLAWFDYGRTFSPSVHPDPDALLKDVDVVVCPMPRAGTVNPERLWEIYGERIEASYRRVARTPHWEVWRRQGGPG